MGKIHDKEAVLINLANPIFHKQKLFSPLGTELFGRFRSKLRQIPFRVNTFRIPWDFCWQYRRYLVSVCCATRFHRYATLIIHYFIYLFNSPMSNFLRLFFFSFKLQISKLFLYKFFKRTNFLDDPFLKNSKTRMIILIYTIH